MRIAPSIALVAWTTCVTHAAFAQPSSPEVPHAGEVPHATPPADAPASDTVGASDTRPAAVVSRVEPPYPPSRLESEHGPDEPLPDVDVELEVSIDEAGAITSVKVLTSGGAEFDQQATEAVQSWAFSPALENGRAIASKLHIPMHFEPPPHPEPPPPIDVSVTARRPPPSRGGGDYRISIGQLDAVPHPTAAKLLELAPSVFLMKDGGGEGHAERVYLRGFDAREGQDIEFSVNGIPINEAGNYHGNGYADLNFIIPELVMNLRVLEGPFDPRQGNFAVAGSADYDLGLKKRGLTAKLTYGAFNTSRLLLMWGPEAETDRTYAAAEINHTDGFGQNRDSSRARAMGQYEGRLGDAGSFRVSTAAYFSEYHSAGLLREDDVTAGKVGFYDTYDPRQGGSAARIHTGVDFETKHEQTVFGLQVFGAYTNLRLRENLTGYLLDTQLARQQPHEQRGDLIDLSDSGGMFGLRGFGRQGFELFGQKQEAEVGLLARGDLVGATQQRDLANTGAPYKTDADLDSRLGDVGMYGDLSLRLLEWLVVRGGAHVDLFAYNVEDLCAVKDVSRPDSDNPPGDAACLTQQRFGDYREANQRSSTATIRAMPRVSVLLGPFTGFSFSAGYGQGVRSIDPSYITQDVETPFSSIDSFETSASYAKSFDALALAVQNVFFVTHVDKDQIFSETEGRATLANGTTRAGWAASVRATGDFFDASLSLSLVTSRFDDTGLVVPYVPDVVFRHDGALFHDLFDLDDSPVRGRVGLGVGVVGARALPYGQRSDVIATLDAGTSLAWRFLELEVQGTNLMNLQYRESEFNYASDFDPSNPETLVPARHFAAGQPLGIFVSLSGTLGGNS